MNIEEAIAKRSTHFIEAKFRREKQMVDKNGNPYERISFSIKEDETWFKIDATLFNDRLVALGKEPAQLDGQWAIFGIAGVTDESYDDEEKGRRVSRAVAARVLFPSELRALFGSAAPVASAKEAVPKKTAPVPQIVEEEDDGF